VITSISPDSSAEEADVQVGDVIIAFDGVPVLGIRDLQAQVRSHQPDEEVEIIILREDEEITINATLGVNTEEVG
jgi:S1-C subfamily serine protease